MVSKSESTFTHKIYSQKFRHERSLTGFNGHSFVLVIVLD